MVYSIRRKRTRKHGHRKRRKSYRRRRPSGKGTGRTFTYSRRGAPRIDPNFRVARTRHRHPRTTKRTRRTGPKWWHAAKARSARAPRSPSTSRMVERPARLAIVQEEGPPPYLTDGNSTGPLADIWKAKDSDYNVKANTITVPMPLYELLPNPS